MAVLKSAVITLLTLTHCVGVETKLINPKYSGCPIEGQARCENDACVRTELICDGNDDCGDNSDEDVDSCNGRFIHDDVGSADFPWWTLSLGTVVVIGVICFIFFLLRRRSYAQRMERQREAARVRESMSPSWNLNNQLQVPNNSQLTTNQYNLQHKMQYNLQYSTQYNQQMTPAGSWNLSSKPLSADLSGPPPPYTDVMQNNTQQQVKYDGQTDIRY